MNRDRVIRTMMIIFGIWWLGIAGIFTFMMGSPGIGALLALLGLLNLWAIRDTIIEARSDKDGKGSG